MAKTNQFARVENGIIQAFGTIDWLKQDFAARFNSTPAFTVEPSNNWLTRYDYVRVLNNPPIQDNLTQTRGPVVDPYLHANGAVYNREVVDRSLTNSKGNYLKEIKVKSITLENGVLWFDTDGSGPYPFQINEKSQRRLNALYTLITDGEVEPHGGNFTDANNVPRSCTDAKLKDLAKAVVGYIRGIHVNKITLGTVIDAASDLSVLRDIDIEAGTYGTQYGWPSNGEP